MVKAIAKIAASPFPYIVIFALAGIAAIVFGTYTLAGIGWAAIVAGSFLLLLSGFIAKGLKPNG
jgi:hypothetical protein